MAKNWDKEAIDCVADKLLDGIDELIKEYDYTDHLIQRRY